MLRKAGWQRGGGEGGTDEYCTHRMSIFIYEYDMSVNVAIIVPTACNACKMKPKADMSLSPTVSITPSRWTCGFLMWIVIPWMVGYVLSTSFASRSAKLSRSMWYGPSMVAFIDLNTVAQTSGAAIHLDMMRDMCILRAMFR